MVKTTLRDLARSSLPRWRHQWYLCQSRISIVLQFVFRNAPNASCGTLIAKSMHKIVHFRTKEWK
jgi:hypothetical protein